MAERAARRGSAQGGAARFAGWLRAAAGWLLLVLLAGGCHGGAASAGETIRIAIGTQDATINCATGGLVIRELHLLEKYLPHEGRYQNVHWDIVWKDFSTGAAITSEMVADKIDIGAMADFPSVLNAVAFQKQGRRSVYLAPLSLSTTGGGNGLMVPVGSPAQKLSDLKGKQISVPFGSAAHGMLLRALRDLGWDPEKDVSIVAQTPEVGGSSLKADKIDAHADFVPFAELFPFRGISRKIYDGGAVGVPTSHGLLARAAYAEKYPEVVVAYLKAAIDADRIVAADPEKYSELIQHVIGVEAEVNYMFHGPLGIQTRDYSIKPEVRQSLQAAVDTLQLLKRTDTHLSVDAFIDDHYLRQAVRELGLDYEARLRSYDKAPLAGPDARTGEPIAEPKLAAQIWIAGEPRARAYASPRSAFAALAAEERAGKKARVVLVHDRGSGQKLFAQKAWYVSDKGDLAAFLVKADADAWAATHGGAVVQFDVARAGS